MLTLTSFKLKLAQTNKLNMIYYARFVLSVDGIPFSFGFVFPTPTIFMLVNFLGENNQTNWKQKLSMMTLVNFPCSCKWEFQHVSSTLFIYFQLSDKYFSVITVNGWQEHSAWQMNLHDLRIENIFVDHNEINILSMWSSWNKLLSIASGFSTAQTTITISVQNYFQKKLSENIILSRYN